MPPNEKGAQRSREVDRLSATPRMAPRQERSKWAILAAEANVSAETDSEIAYSLGGVIAGFFRLGKFSG